jgi:hypothetical protein
MFSTGIFAADFPYLLLGILYSVYLLLFSLHKLNQKADEFSEDSLNQKIRVLGKSEKLFYIYVIHLPGYLLHVSVKSFCHAFARLQDHSFFNGPANRIPALFVTGGVVTLPKPPPVIA